MKLDSTTAATNSTAGTVIQGSVTSVFIAFLYETITIMIPFLAAAFVLIIVDLYFGVHAAKKRGERTTVSRGLRLTINKVFEYTCWVVLSASLAAAFELPSLNWIILSLVYGNEVISIATNYAELHGKKITGLKEALLKAIGKKVDVDLSDIRIEEKEKGER